MVIKKILLTGGAGFIGSHLLESLIKKGYEVAVLEKGLADTWRISHLMGRIKYYLVERDNIEDIFQKSGFDCVMHLATFYKKRRSGLEDIEQMIFSNISSPTTILEAAKNHGVKYFINTGSSFEYRPSNKEALTESSQIEAFNFYAATKISFENILKFFSNRHGLKAITLKLFYPYGEKDNRKMVFHLIQGLLKGEVVKMTAGEQEMNFTYVLDIVSAYLRALDYVVEMKKGYDFFNIGSNQAISLKKTVRVMEQVSQKKMSVKWGKVLYLPNDIFYVNCGNKKARKVLGWQPKYDFKTGIKRTYLYYKDKKSYEPGFPVNPIPIVGPSITQLEIGAVSQAIKDCWFGNYNKYLNQFQKEFAEYLGVKYAIATSSCHGALHMGLAGLGIKEGDEVIVPDLTWIASAAVVRYVGAKPVLVDIDPVTWCIDPVKAEKAITKRTKAIIPVAMYGHPPAMKEILSLAKKYGLAVIEDAAQAIGSTYYSKKVGSFGDFAAFSFHGTKVMTTGEGGMFVTNSKKLYDEVYSISNIGKHPTKPFWNIRLGLKYKMTDLQAALGLAQLRRIDELVDKKRLIFNWYKEGLKKAKGLVFNAELPYCFTNYWMPAVIIDKSYGLKKENVLEMLRQYNIIARPFFYPLSVMPPFRAKLNNPVAYRVSKYGINLPCFHDITEQQVDYICQCLLKILKV